MSVLAQQEVGEERAGLIEEHAEPPEHAVELGAERVVSLVGALEHLSEGREVGGEKLPGEIVLAPEVPIDGAFGDAGRSGNVSGRSLAQPALHEKPQGFVQDLPPGWASVPHE